MRVLALDPSKNSAGWAVWGPGDANLASGWWQLGSELTSPGKVFGKLHEQMSGINAIGTIDAIFYEKPRHLDGFNVESDAATHLLMVGLSAHIESWGDAMGCRMIRSVHMKTWRRHFIEPPRNMKSADLKALAMEKARALGFKPQKHDQAEAIGILDYACDYLKQSPPWRAPTLRQATFA